MSPRNESPGCGGCFGRVLGMVLGTYISFGFVYGEYRAWKDMGFVTLINPAAHLYAVWCGLTWPMYFFDDDDPAENVEPSPKDEADGQQSAFLVTYERDSGGINLWRSCRLISEDELQLLLDEFAPYGMAHACPIGTGMIDGKQAAAVLCGSNAECEAERISLVSAIEEGSISGFDAAVGFLNVE